MPCIQYKMLRDLQIPQARRRVMERSWKVVRRKFIAVSVESSRKGGVRLGSADFPLLTVFLMDICMCAFNAFWIRLGAEFQSFWPSVLIINSIKRINE